MSWRAPVRRGGGPRARRPSYRGLSAYEGKTSKDGRVREANLAG